MHFPSIYLFNAAVLIGLVAVAHALMAWKFWHDVYNAPKVNKIARAIAIHFTAWAVASAWSSVYTLYDLLGNETYLAAVLLIRDICLTLLLFSVVYLYMELTHGNGS